MSSPCRCDALLVHATCLLQVETTYMWFFPHQAVQVYVSEPPFRGAIHGTPEDLWCNRVSWSPGRDAKQRMKNDHRHVSWNVCSNLTNLIQRTSVALKELRELFLIQWCLCPLKCLLPLPRRRWDLSPRGGLLVCVCLLFLRLLHKI